MAIRSSILVWEIPRTEEPGGLQPTGLQRGRNHRGAEHTHAHTQHLLLATRAKRWCLFVSLNYCPHMRVINILELDRFLENLRNMSRANLSC